MQNKLDEYLKSTKYCDSESKKIIDFTTYLIKDCVDEFSVVKRLFNFIKNNYKYSFGKWCLKASEVINKKRGMCTTKTNLFVACLRSLKIPARFHVIRIKARDIFGNFSGIKFLTNKISNNSVHIYAEVFIYGRWICLDTSLDEGLIKGLRKSGHADIPVQWDGKSDYINFIHEDMIVEDLGVLANIDNYHEKQRKTAKLSFIIFSNLLMSYYRFLGR